MILYRYLHPLSSGYLFPRRSFGGNLNSGNSNFDLHSTFLRCQYTCVGIVNPRSNGSATKAVDSVAFSLRLGQPRLTNAVFLHRCMKNEVPRSTKSQLQASFNLSRPASSGTRRCVTQLFGLGNNAIVVNRITRHAIGAKPFCLFVWTD